MCSERTDVKIDVRDTTRCASIRLEFHMFWKVLGFIVLIWIALALLGTIIKGVFWLVVAGAIVLGLVWLYKAISSNDDHPSLKF
ncbi:hypothetical protein CH294_23420 [Rhodococcus sp. 14-2483-1-1]|nr:hypothetical protein CH286_23175 [Rhodococcus sp. WWJCD1]OZC82067.1 hypothetical protein CH254_27595 [Rhodococcus sp. 06-412-2C]OZC95002.1 hypothetical protein CH279_16950 [Rhodococcus sp. 06-412-2B]OZE74540.1 hypothetical protein CH305_23355 [Rhodococcus sp. 15-649-2-2]OZF30060.1 hypothetical protein CH294_23420 [Rhodococcus sp. 14-2483-1-1]